MCNTIGEVTLNKTGVVIVCGCGCQRFVFAVQTYEGRREIKQTGGNWIVPNKTLGNHFTSGTTLF
jgi:hypothetical protein